jgi:hypothetical protein
MCKTHYPANLWKLSHKFSTNFPANFSTSFPQKTPEQSLKTERQKPEHFSNPNKIQHPNMPQKPEQD